MPEYKLQEYDPLAKRRAILVRIKGGPMPGIVPREDAPDRWAPVAWVDYDDVGREEADERAEAMLRGLRGEEDRPASVTETAEDVPAHRRWKSEAPGKFPAPDDEVVRVEARVEYPNGLFAPPSLVVARWWPEHEAALREDGSGFSPEHGQYRMVARDHPGDAAGILFGFYADMVLGALRRFADSQRAGLRSVE